MKSNTSKSTKFDAILSTVHALKDAGLVEHHITAERILKGYSDKHRSIEIDGIEAQGYSRGSPNDFYQYLKIAKREVFAKDEVERAGLEVEVQGLKKEKGALLDTISELKEMIDRLENQSSELENQIRDKDALIIYKSDRIRDLEIENRVLSEKMGDLMVMQSSTQNLISEFKQTIVQEYEAKNALMTKEMKYKVTRSEG